MRVSPEQWAANPNNPYREGPTNAFMVDPFEMFSSFGGGIGGRDNRADGPWGQPAGGQNWGQKASGLGDIFLSSRGAPPSFGAATRKANPTIASQQPQVAPIFTSNYFNPQGVRNSWIFNRNVEWPSNFSNPLIRL